MKLIRNVIEYFFLLDILRNLNMKGLLAQKFYEQAKSCKEKNQIALLQKIQQS